MFKRRIFVLISMIAILAMAVPASGQGTGPELPDGFQPKTGSTVYIVQMADLPVVAYEGDIAGYPATKPAAGKKINPLDPKVVKYAGYLKNRHDAAINGVGANGKKLYSYTYSFNGFAVRLTPAQLKQMNGQAGVVHIWQDELRQKATDNSPDFLGLTAPGGLWAQGVKGENVIIGVIDTGIWPEHPSFSDRTGTNPNGKPGKLAYQQIPGWHGKCVPGELFNASNCNQKLIGAQYFYAAWGPDGITNDYLSARDRDGHGTHTASTAGGNAGVHATILGTDFGTISGIAPRARIAVYKGLWNDLGGYSSDLAAAIDQAVADGVDVINYSIGSSGYTLGPDDIAFLFAAQAGIFVATSAGNAGPGASTIGSPASAPWVTTVGASTQDRAYIGSVESSYGWEFSGTTITQGTSELQIVDAFDYGDELCGPGNLDAGVAGKIVLCKRGGYNRVDKSLAVSYAGGAGMVLYNANDFQTKDTDNHWVPSVHINNTDGLAIKAYITSMGDSAVAQINAGTNTPTSAPNMADFSSRGPNLQSPDVIKPDITAPGVNILAGNTPTPYLGSPGEMFQMIGGTSMSSPHIAGVFALLKQANPSWSAAMAKSAIMTTAYQAVMKEDGVTPADPFDFGAGHVAPNSAVDPGLVYNTGHNNYLGYICAVDPSLFGGNADYYCNTRFPLLGISTDPSQLNLPSMAIGALAGVETLARKVTSVTPGNSTYTASIEGLAGIDVEVNPSSISLNYGQSAPFDVTFTVTSAPVDTWSFGALIWSDGVHSVRSPIAVKPVAFAAPDEVFGFGTDGSLDFDVTFGYDGTYTAAAHGLEPADMQPDNVLDDPANDIDTALGTCDFGAAFPWPCTGITWHAFTVPAGSVYARFSLFDDFTDGADDLDLYVWDSSWGFVGSSGTGTSAEQVDVFAPPADTYLIAVHGWGTDGPDANYTLFSWAFGADSGNMTLTAPAVAVIGTTATITVDWAGLLADQKYLGAVSHTGPGGLLGLTLVNIDTIP